MSVSLETLDRLKDELKTPHFLSAHVRTDLYRHLSEVYSRIMTHHVEDAFDKLEEISSLIKQTHLDIKDPKLDTEILGRRLL